VSFHVPEQHRITTGRAKSDTSFGNNGAFRVPLRKGRTVYYASVIASDGAGWEHVSVSFENRTPTWEEMCQIKAIFWDSDDVVIQYHPRASDYVNMHRHCLHLWRPTDSEVPTPPPILVGLRPDMLTRSISHGG
jgi:hypothetical protein